MLWEYPAVPGMSLPSIPATRAAITSFIQHDQVIANNFCSKFFIAFLIFPTVVFSNGLQYKPDFLYADIFVQVLPVPAKKQRYAILFVKLICRFCPYRFP